MKQRAKFKVDILPVLGIIGLLLVMLYFLLANFGQSDTGELPPDDPYYLFTRLYKKLGYPVIDHYPRRLPEPDQDLIIYLNYEKNPKELKKLLNQWVKRGGTLWIAGIEGDRDPIESNELAGSNLKTVYSGAVNPEAGASGSKPVFRLKGKYTRHFLPDNNLDPKGILLYARQGPLLYKTKQGDGTIFVLSDSALITNEFLRQDKAAVFFNRILRPYFGKRIYIHRRDLSGPQKTTPVLALLFKDKLLFITLQLLWIMALFMAREGKRFGEPQLIDPYARRTLSEHLKAVGHFYQKAGSPGIVDEINGEYFKSMLAKITGLQWKDPPTPGDIEKIKNHLAAHDPGITPEQIRDLLKKDPHITTSRLISKAKEQDRVLKRLKSKD
jgi:hypothetical protein